MHSQGNLEIQTQVNDVVENAVNDHAFYEYDFERKKYVFFSPSIYELTGYSREDINKIGFERIIRNEVEDVKYQYSSKDDNIEYRIDEAFITCLIETSKGEFKWIENNSITMIDMSGLPYKRYGILKDVTVVMRDEKVRQVISEILETANSEKKLEELFSFIHNSVKKLMKAENFYIAYYLRDSDMLSFPYFVDEEDTDSSTKKPGKGLTEYVLRTGISALIDIPKDAELRKKGEIELIGPQSEIWLGVPLKIKDKTIGVLVVQDYNDPNTYGKAEQQILDFISYPISRAIERKMVEEEREEMILKLKELNKSKDQLFSLISHDLRSPFNSLLGFSEILSTEFDTLTQRDIKEYLNVINESAKTLFGMTNNLLHYSRIQLGKFISKPHQVNLDEAVRIVQELMNDRVKKKDLLIKKEIPKDYNVYFDGDMLNIILENIISNSIKYSNKSGIIKIFAEKTEMENDEVSLQLSITDEGVGINEENQKKIKSNVMFSTLGTSKEFGSGIGLLLAKDLILLNRGNLEILSGEGAGTTIILTLPVNKTEDIRDS